MCPVFTAVTEAVMGLLEHVRCLVTSLGEAARRDSQQEVGEDPWGLEALALLQPKAWQGEVTTYLVPGSS